MEKYIILAKLIFPHPPWIYVLIRRKLLCSYSPCLIWFLQYLRPHDHGKLSQVELLVIDEAAAIPLPIVKSMLGPYLVFLSSTVNGYVCSYFLWYHKSWTKSTIMILCCRYEGTGRSLSLKLLQQLESQSQPSAQSNGSNSSKSCLSFQFQLLLFGRNDVSCFALAFLV